MELLHYAVSRSFSFLHITSRHYSTLFLGLNWWKSLAIYPAIIFRHNPELETCDVDINPYSDFTPTELTVTGRPFLDYYVTVQSTVAVLKKSVISLICLEVN